MATKQLVPATIEQCAGNLFHAAQILGIPPARRIGFRSLRP